MLIAALAVGVAVVAVYFLRTDDSNSPVAPSSWIVDAAVAMNRASIHGEAVSDSARLPTGNSTVALQFAHEGERLRVQRKFAEAEAAYREAVNADPLDADSWADLADSAAAAAGNDLTGSRDAIMRALAINPHHRKALWLRASLELQELRYASAAATWRELQSLMPAGSNDARIIAANIVEADALARSVTVADGRGS
jgi:tetratricopeptide (TPR) repeat protein